MKIFLDVDGVLADFVAAACRLHGKDSTEVTGWNFFEGWGMSEKDFWHPINKLGVGFYGSHVKPFPWIEYLVRTVMSYDHDFTLCTVCGGRTVEDKIGKLLWVERYIGGVPMITMSGPMKQLLARDEDCVLIDDCDRNIDSFEDAGGTGVVFPQPWNSMRTMAQDPVHHVKLALEDIKNYGYPLGQMISLTQSKGE